MVRNQPGKVAVKPTPDGIRVVLCEANAGRPLPEYAERRRLHAAITSRGGAGGIVVFTDAAHSTFVWTRALAIRFGGVRWVEYRTPPRNAAVRRELSRLAIGPKVPSADGETVEDRSEVTRALYSDLLAGSRGAVPSVRALLDHIAGSDDAGQIRRLWRRIGAVSALDLDCGSGEWLQAAAEVLEPVYLACLDRMRSFVDDARSSRPGRRPEYFRDLRSIVEVAEDDRKHEGPEEYVRRLVVQRNLYGVALSRGDLGATRERLARFTRRRGGGSSVVDANIVLLRGAIGAAARAGTRGGSIGVRTEKEWARSGLGEEAEILSQTAALLRSRRLAGEDSRELRIAADQLGRRRDVLLIRMESTMLRGGGDPHPSIVLNAALLRPASANFHLVRSPG